MINTNIDGNIYNIIYQFYSIYHIQIIIVIIIECFIHYQNIYTTMRKFLSIHHFEDELCLKK
jgi:hypothetical protein